MSVINALLFIAFLFCLVKVVTNSDPKEHFLQIGGLCLLLFFFLMSVNEAMDLVVSP